MKNRPKSACVRPRNRSAAPKKRAASVSLLVLLLFLAAPAWAQSADEVSPWVLFHPDIGLGEARLPRGFSETFQGIVLPDGAHFVAVEAGSEQDKLAYVLNITESWAGPLTAGETKATIKGFGALSAGAQGLHETIVRFDDGGWVHDLNFSTDAGATHIRTLYADTAMLRLAVLSPPGAESAAKARQFLDSGRLLPKVPILQDPIPWSVTRSGPFNQATPPPGTPFVPTAPSVTVQQEGARTSLALRVLDPVRASAMDYIVMGYRFPYSLTDANALEVVQREVLAPLGFVSRPETLRVIPTSPGVRAFEGLLALPGTGDRLRLRITIAGPVLILQFAKGPAPLVQAGLTTALLDGLTLP